MLKLSNTPSSSSVQTFYTDLHKLFLVTKLSHYVTKSYAAHGAFGRTYDSLDELIDTITEKLIGYTKSDPTEFTIGTIKAISPAELADQIITLAGKLEQFAKSKYPDIENLAQELSGVGAQLKYLSRFP